ncbi:MAG: nitroreductase family protein [Bacillota bacterium]
MQDFWEIVAGRRSIRKFKPTPVPLDDLKAIVRAGILAPSASNKQMWKFSAITNAALLGQMHDVVAAKMDKLAAEMEAHGTDKVVRSMRPYATFFNQAPCVLLVLQEPYRGRMDTALVEAGYDACALMEKHGYGGPQSIGAAIQNILLAAHAKGYGACWMCAPLAAQEELCALLHITPPWRIAALIPLGLPAEAPEARPRKPLEEVFSIIE